MYFTDKLLFTYFLFELFLIFPLKNKMNNFNFTLFTNERTYLLKNKFFKCYKDICSYFSLEWNAVQLFFQKSRIENN